MIRGELWTAAGGVYASKPRPALIMQDDLFAATDSVTVIPLTTTLTGASLLRVRIPADAMSGLECDSDIMIDKLTTVHRANVHEMVGRLSAHQLVEVERALLVFLGMAR
jgi:mRNA interferase MazF